MANPFDVRVPNVLEALMAGQSGYNDVRGMISQREQDAARREAQSALMGGDTRGALAQLIGANDPRMVQALGSYEQTANSVHGTPIMLQRPDGSYAVGSFDKGGNPRIIDFGPGLSPTVPSKSIEGPTGTHVIPGRVTGMPGQVPATTPGQSPQGQPVPGQYPTQGFYPKDNRTAARDKEEGNQEGKISAQLPTSVLQANQTVKLIDELLGDEKAGKPSHPGLNSIVGPIDQYRPSILLGGAGRDALARWEQLQGKAFGAAFDMLRGGGAITETEGVKATNAYARMQRYQGESEFRAALKDFRDAVADGARKLAERAGPSGAQYQSQIPAGAAQQPGLPAPPRVGETRDGYRFKGGDPADQSSWVKMR